MLYEADETMLQTIKKNRRCHPRYSFRFVIKETLPNEAGIAKGAVGQIVDVSEGGFGAVMHNAPPKSSLLTLSISSFLHKAPIQVEVKVRWVKTIYKTMFKCGFEIVSIEKEHSLIIKDILSTCARLKPEFVELTQETSFFNEKLKNECDAFDKNCADEKKRTAFVLEMKKDIFPKLDAHVNKLWESVRVMTAEERLIHQRFAQEMLNPTVTDLVQTNRHVYYKPLGYSGDFQMMNFIYDYQGDNRFLGNTSYEMFFNNYTCNIPMGHSNLARKIYLKEKILETMDRVPGNTQAQILSIASGPAREITDLLREDKIVKPVKFRCLDFEQRALDYVKSELESISVSKKSFFEIEFFCENIISVMRKKELKERLGGEHLIYAFGIYDYLSDRLASRFTKDLFNLLLPDGKLVICNASSEHEDHRGYYELLGEWNMIFRSKEEMSEWAQNLGDDSQFFFEQPNDFLNYWYLVISRK